MQTKAALAGVAATTRLPGGSRIIDVTSEGPQRPRTDKSDLAPKPIVYADDVAGILRAIHEKRQAQAASIAVPTPALQPNAVVTV